MTASDSPFRQFPDGTLEREAVQYGELVAVAQCCRFSKMLNSKQRQSMRTASSRASAVKVQAVVMQPSAKPAVGASPSSSSSTVVSSWTEWQPLKEIIVGRCK